MNSLIIGGAGFIGSHLDDALLSRGDRVVALDNLLRGKMSNIAHLEGNDHFTFIKGDSNDEELLLKIIHEYKINYIYHLAANSDIQASAKNPQIEFEDTAKTTWTILSAMSKSGVKNLFFSSTSAIYGQHDEPISESEALLHPISYYGSAKLASEAFIDAFSYMNDFNVLVFRFPNVIGPRLTHGVVFDFINRLRKNPNELVVLGNGEQEKPYIYVSDLIDAILKFDLTNKGVNVYNVGVDSSSKVKHIAETVVKKMKLTNCKIVYGKENRGWKGDISKFQYNLNKIHKAGWKAKYTSDEAIDLAIDSYLSSLKK